MEIKLAETLGYCPGVKRALDLAFRLLARRDGEVFSHGELIHNGPMLELLAQKGLKPWRGETKGTIIIRAHGLPPAETEALKALGLTVRDATCPRVRLAQALAAREAARGRLVIIWGQADHPETIGLLGHAGAQGRTAAGPEDVAGLPEAAQVFLEAQTTQDLASWPAMAAAVRARWPEAAIRNTICAATAARQAQVEALVKEADALVVVGGRTSGNTRRLADLGRRAGCRVFPTETGADLKPEDFRGLRRVALAAGASTSNWQIAQALQTLRALARDRSPAFWLRLWRALVLSSVWAALGLAGLAQGAGLILGLRPPATIFSFFFFLAAALHLLRDLIKSREPTLRLTDPDRTLFFAKYRRGLFFLAALSFAMSLAAAALTDPALAWLVAGGALAALAHKFTPRPEKPALIRALALAKPPLLGLGWAAAALWAARTGIYQAAAGQATACQAAACQAGPRLSPALFAGGLVFCHLAALAVLSDVLAIKGDRIFGRPTLPSCLSETALRLLLSACMAAWALALAAAAPPGLAAALILSGPLYNLALIRRLCPQPNKKSGQAGPALYDYRFEAVLFGQLLASGLALRLWLSP